MPNRHSSLRDRQRWLKQRLAPEQAADDLREAGVYAFEEHFTAGRLAKMLALDESTGCRIFRVQPGVLLISEAPFGLGDRSVSDARLRRNAVSGRQCNQVPLVLEELPR